MSRRAWVLLALLSAFWGGSYLFIKVALEDGVPPAVVVFVRVALAALVLVPLAARRGVLDSLRGQWGAIAVLALVNVAAPFMLITVGEQDLPSALTGILVATAPIFTFLLAFALRGEQRAGALSLLGVAIGLLGVALLLGVDAEGSAALVAGLLVVLASFGYGVGSWYLKRNLVGVDSLALVSGTMVASTLMTAPLLALETPSAADFELDSLASLLVLGVVGTGISFIIYYYLIATEGPANASLVGYVAPVFSVSYGVTILDEPFTAATVAGLMLIVGGSWLAVDGRVPWRGLQARAAS